MKQLTAPVSQPSISPAEETRLMASLRKPTAASPLLVAREQAQATNSAVVVPSMTTSTSQTAAQPDGSLTTTDSVSPVRWQDSPGAWHALDLTLQPLAGVAGWLGGLSAPSGAGSASSGGSTINMVAGGVVAQIPTSAGTFSLAHPGALPIPGLTGGTTETFPAALGGSDITERLLVDGVEDSVVEHSPRAGATYALTVGLPTGVMAQQTDTGVVFVDGAGTTVGRLAGGTAHDSTSDPSGDGLTTLVTSTLTGQQPGSATVAVSVDPAWLSAPARQFPVTIDPTFTINDTASGGQDAYTDSANPTTTEGTYNPTELHLGTYNGGASSNRTYITIPLTGLPSYSVISSATLSVDNYYSWSCTAGSLALQGANASWGAGSLTYNNEPQASSVAATSASFADGYSSSCPGKFESIDATGLVKSWLAGSTPNYGFLLSTSTTNDYGWKKFEPGDNGASTAPYLTVNWNYPTLAAPTNLGDEHVGTFTPVLSARANGPSGSSITMHFTVADATLSTVVGNYVYAGNLSPGQNASYTLPATLEQVGHVYIWSAYGCYAGTTTCSDNSATTEAFRQQDGAGSTRQYSADSFTLDNKLSGSVNVADGNLSLDFAGLSLPTLGSSYPVGLAYNSQTLAATEVGPGWETSSAPDYRLASTAGDWALFDPSGHLSEFTPDTAHAGYFKPPAGLDATLHTVTGGEQLTFHSSGQVDMFDTSGKLVYIADRNANVTPGYNGSDVNDNKILFATSGNTTTITGDRDTGSGLQAVLTFAGGSGSNQLSTVAQSDGNGLSRTISLGYDSANRLQTITEPVTSASNRTTTFSYDSSSRVSQVAISAGSWSSTSTFTYDSSNRLTQLVRDPSGKAATTTYAYDIGGATKTNYRWDPDHPQGSNNTGVYTKYVYQNDGGVTAATDPLGHKRSSTFNTDDNITSAVDGLNGTSSASFVAATAGTDMEANANGSENLGTTTDQAGSSSSLGYTGGANSATNATGAYQAQSSTDSNGNATTFTYDGPGNLQSQSQGTTTSAKATINHGTVGVAKGLSINSVDPNNAGTTTGGSRCGSATAPDCNSYGYDNYGDITSVTPVTVTTGSQLGGQAFTYDGFGRTLTATNGLGITATNSYNLLDQITSTSYTGSNPTISYTYDGYGAPTLRTYGSVSTAYAYDSLERLTGENTAGTTVSCPASPTNSMLCYGYDAAGNLTGLSDGRGTDSYLYDADNELVQLNEASGRADVFVYDADGRRTQTFLNASGQGAQTATGTITAPTAWTGRTTSTLDAAGKPMEIKTVDGASNTIADLTYTYVPNTSICPTGEQDSGKPTRVETASSTITGGGTTSLIYCYGGSNGGGGNARLVDVYDTAGNHAYGFGYDSDGNLINGSRGTHTYNEANQLTDTGASYDADGNQTAGTANAGTLAQTFSATDQTLTQNVAGNIQNDSYAATNQVERMSAGNTSFTAGRTGTVGQPSLQSTTSSGQIRYYVRDNTGALIGTETATTTSPAVTAATSEDYYLTDISDNVIALISQTGELTGTYTYDPYGGNMTASGTDAAANPYRYASAYLDPTTGLYKMGARYYNPATGAFTQQDDPTHTGNLAQGDRYTYAGDDPINNLDPTGQFSLSFNVSACLDLCLGLSASIDSSGDIGVGESLGVGSPSLSGGADISTSDVTTGVSPDLTCAAGPISTDTSLENLDTSVAAGTEIASPGCSVDFEASQELGTL